MKAKNIKETFELAIQNHKENNFEIYLGTKNIQNFIKDKELISKTASNMQIREAIYQNSINKYSPYKEFFENYENKYFWFNFN